MFYSDGMNDLSNISMISMAHVNETANATNMTNMTRIETDDVLTSLDVTRMPTEMFLDACKVKTRIVTGYARIPFQIIS
mgnify:CR=1 FL=1